MLASLDSAEQKIWEMTDASDRNAARFAASLAQLEKHKETVDSLLDELEVTRNLLAAEQARALEQERMLASERAKMARAGIGIEGFPSSAGREEDPFAGFDGEAMLDLGADERGGKPKPAAGAKPGARPSVAAAKKPARPGGKDLDLDHALASLTDEDSDESSFADLNTKPATPEVKPAPPQIEPPKVEPPEAKPPEAKPPEPEPDAPTERTRQRSSSKSSPAAAAAPTPASGVPSEVRTSGSRKLEISATRARMTVEEVDDDEWPED